MLIVVGGISSELRPQKVVEVYMDEKTNELRPKEVNVFEEEKSFGCFSMEFYTPCYRRMHKETVWLSRELWPPKSTRVKKETFVEKLMLK